MKNPFLGAATAAALLAATSSSASTGSTTDDRVTGQPLRIVPAADAKLPPLAPPIPQLATRPGQAGAASEPVVPPVPQLAIRPQRLAALPELQLPMLVPPVPQPAIRPQRLAAIPETQLAPPVPQPAVRPPRRESRSDRLRTCLKPAARALLDRIEAEFGPMDIISTCRPGARIAGTGRISKHATGEAIDFNAGRRKGDVVRWLIANHKSGGIMTYAGMSHIHVDVGHRFVALNAHGGR
jgi:hypothetical protein